MSDIFISYARSTATQAGRIAKALRGLGYGVWRDDELPAHRTYSEVIEERLRAAKAVVVVWSAEAVKSQWVRAEADAARQAGTLVQLSIDGTLPHMPFNQIQCADLTGWSGDTDAHDWRKVLASIADLAGRPGAAPAPAADPPPALPSKPSIAVLPFTNLSNDPDQDYFADGMMEEIVTALTRVRSIFVIASGSTTVFKGKAVGAREVATMLGVRYVLEGSVRKAANRVRIAVKLIDASDGAQIRDDRFEDTLEDVFALQDRVALSVAGVIEPAVQDAEVRRAFKRQSVNLGSYDLYLRALPVYRIFRREETSLTLDMLDSAIALDPDYGIALAVAATCHSRIVGFGWSDDLEGHRLEGLRLVDRALKAGGDDPEVLAQVASALRQLEQNLDREVALISRAVALNPGSSFAWLTSGILRSRLGEPDIAIEHLETAMRLAPLSLTNDVARLNVAIALFQQRRFDEALALFRQCTFRAPTSFAIVAALYGHLGRTSEAQEALARYRALASAPIDEFAAVFFRRPEDQKLIQDGIALAQEKTPSGATYEAIPRP